MGRLTEEQACAIETRDTSVALRAGAGCGKTFVLTERFLSHLDPAQEYPAQLGELLAITFTERAAREMRDRIRRFCYDRIRSAPANEIEAWTELLRELDTARVTTIHAFCAGLLRRHAIEADLDPQFTVLEQTQSDLILHELIDDQLRDDLARRDETTIQLAVLFSLVPLRDKLRRMVDSTRGKELESWLAKSPESLAQTWNDFAREKTWPTILTNLSQSTEARDLVCLLRTSAPSNDEMRERVERILTVERLTDVDDPRAALEAILESARVKGGATKKHWDNDADYNAYRDGAAALRKAVERALGFAPDDNSAATREAEVALQLLEKASQIGVEYDRRKQELGALDFDDLVHGASKLLNSPGNEGLRRRVAAQFSLVLVDEFQDTDRVQVDLVKALCGDDLANGKLFFVGDFKQSIYRFRGADPGVFAELQREIPPSGNMSLTRNFRSVPAVLDFVNALFVDRFDTTYEPLEAFRVDPRDEAKCIKFMWPEAGPGESPRAAGATH
ncbi:MAG: UvrD-helicase domain-containing protein, partial [Pirellulales bacterium]|nr:UvrD-helicase domain-containing protein [Pirellulales bacterium]